MGRIRLPSNLRRHVWPASLLTLAYFVLASKLWSAGYPSGADAWAHLFRAEYLADQMRLSGLSAYFTTAWMPNWYMGDPFRTYYPPATTLLFAPIVYLARQPVLAHSIFVSWLVLSFGVLTYAFLNSQWGRSSAAFGTLLALVAPYQMRTLLFEGNYPRFLVLLALPPLAWLSERLLSTPGRKAPVLALLASTWAWAILSHPQQAFMFAIGLGFYVLFRLFLDPDIPFRRGFLWIAGAGLGSFLAAPWALPAYSQAELSNVPFLPLEKVGLFTAPISALLPTLDAADGRILFGVGALALAILAAASRPEPRRTAWVLSGLVAIWLSLGSPGVAFRLLPLSDQLLPERFLNFAAFALPVAAAGLLPMRKRSVFIRGVVIVGLALLDIIPGLSVLPRGKFPQEEAALAASLSNLNASPGERAILVTYPEPTAKEVYYSSKVMPLVNGWALENTPHQEALRRYLDSTAWPSEYLGVLLGRWSVGTVVVEQAPDAIAFPTDALARANYRPEADVGKYTIYRLDGPVSPVQRLPEDRMLLVGERLAPFIMAFPFAEESGSKTVSGLEQDVFQEYPVMGLYNFESSSSGVSSIGERLHSFVEAGGVIVVDLSGMEDDFGRTLDFFDVSVMRVSFHQTLSIEWEPNLAHLPEVYDLTRVAPQGWSGATYRGLDRVLARAAYEDEMLPVLGYRQVGKGRVWFVGANLLYYAQQTANEDLVDAIRGLAVSTSELSTGPRFEAVPVTEWHTTGDGLSFSYSLDRPATEALISYTYSPRFRVRVDGEAVEARSFEHLLSVDLPAGQHDVAVVYDPFGTVWPLAGLAVGIGGAMMLIAGYVYEGRSYVPLVVPDEGAEPPADREYAPCANCGFLLSEVGPPTPVTYPFQVVDCPICGLGMDDDGFHPGESLSEAERRLRLDDWLRSHEYDPETVHTRWGFTADQFFGSPEGAGPPPLAEHDEAAGDVE